MTSSLHTLLAGLIDYAGLFPPANLPLEQAIGNYAHYRQGPDAWMLGRFICPAGKLLSTFPDELFHSEQLVPFSVLGPSERDWVKYLDELKETLRSLTEFRDHYAGRAVADVLEMKVPEAILEASDPKALSDRLNDLCALIDLAGFHDLTIFFECGLGSGLRTVETLLDAIAICNREGLPLAGFKLRCGGLKAAAFPTVDQLAFVLRHAVMNEVPLKATAGLHHPLPSFDATLQTPMHGFLNLFVAGVLEYARHPEPSVLVEILKEEDPKHFRFDETGLHWRFLSATTAEIAAARKESVISFGSCSFDEPRADLRTLGWLR